jgi:hypothetical protein
LTVAVAFAADEDPDVKTLKTLAARCGSEIAWQESWEQASERAKAEQKPILVLFRSLAGIDVPDGSMLGPFMDSDIIELVGERYVALRFAKGMNAPFVAQDSSYGMGPFSFGTSILVATADGRVVGDSFSLESSSLYDFLVEQLRPYHRDPPGQRAGADLIEWHLRGGDLAAAAPLLSKPKSAREHRLHATLLRRQRRGEEALAAIARARAAGGNEIEADVAVEEAEILARLDRIEEAERALARIPAGHVSAAAGQFLKGSFRLAHSDPPGAIAQWKELVRSQPENRWAWLAAAYLLAADLLARTPLRQASRGPAPMCSPPLSDVRPRSSISVRSTERPPPRSGSCSTFSARTARGSCRARCWHVRTRARATSSSPPRCCAPAR